MNDINGTITELDKKMKNKFLIKSDFSKSLFYNLDSKRERDRDSERRRCKIIEMKFNFTVSLFILNSVNGIKVVLIN